MVQRRQVLTVFDVAVAAMLLFLFTAPAQAQQDGRTAIFVRFEDQLFPAGGDYENFCEQRAEIPRSENRAHVLAELKRRAESSWTECARMLDRLQPDGDVVDLQRYWIVNGFACRANADAIREIEAHDGVALVYRVPLPLVPALHDRPVQGGAVEACQPIYESVLEEWVNDDDAPDIPCVIAAAGIGPDGKQPVFSSEGPCFWNDVPFYEDFPPDDPLRKPDVTGVASGVPVWWRTAGIQRRRNWELVADEGGGIGLVTGPQGNSFAGPHAAGVAALVLSASPELNAWQVKRIIESTCRDLGVDGWDSKYGHGLLDAAAAVQAARTVD